VNRINSVLVHPEGAGFMSNVTVKKVLVASMGAALAGALAHSGSADAAVLSASNGFADDSSQSECFQRSWNNPGQVRHKVECDGVSGWWDIPMPIFTTGNKNFSVHIKSTWGGIFVNTVDVFVLGANGMISRWNEQRFDGPFEGWINFPTLAVNSNESATIQFLLPDGPEGHSADSYISAVKGF
jgi:hypothetical protein